MFTAASTLSQIPIRSHQRLLLHHNDHLRYRIRFSATMTSSLPASAQHATYGLRLFPFLSLSLSLL